MNDYEWLWTVFPPAIIVLSILFHLSHFINLLSKNMKNENLYIFFVWLTAMDCTVLFTSLLNDWLIHSLYVDIRATTTWACRFHRWLSGLALDVPPWIIILMTYEKRAFLWYPVPADSQFSRSIAKSLVVGLTLLFAIRHSEVVVYEVEPAINSSTNNVDDEAVVCVMEESATSVFLELFSPWLDLLLRVLSPFVCLSTYNVLIVRKLRRESYCAQQLMLKVGIAAPTWLHNGLQEVARTVVRTVALTAAMLVCGLPYSLYFVVMPLKASRVSGAYQPGWLLTASVLLYINYGWLYAVFALEDHHLLLCLRGTWRNHMSRKRGTHFASMPPRLHSTHSLPALGFSCLLDFMCGRSPDTIRHHTPIHENPEWDARTQTHRDSGIQVQPRNYNITMPGSIIRNNSFITPSH